jgi:hypothetical protein
MEIRVTRSLEQSATPLEDGVLYLSIGMLARIQSESELVGLLSHELAHVQQPSRTPPNGGVEIPSTCVLGSTLTPTRSVSQLHEEELRATSEAIRYAKLADYDPLSGLEFLSKLAYENPMWGKTILSEDLLDLRAVLEPEAPPARGYILDTSDFMPQHARIVASLSEIPSRKSPASLKLLRKP